MFANAFAVTTDDIYDNSYALVIGIDKYENTPLDYAVKDAESVANLLKESFNFSIRSEFYAGYANALNLKCKPESLQHFIGKETI